MVSDGDPAKRSKIISQPVYLEKTEREPGESNISTLMQRIAGSSMAEVDRLTSELYSLRELLQSEGTRVQREIAEYAHLSESVMQSTEIIFEALGAGETKMRGRAAADSAVSYPSGEVG
jgi:hypothetical protein